MKGIRKISEYKIVRNVKCDKYFVTVKKEKYDTFVGTLGRRKYLLSYELNQIGSIKWRSYPTLTVQGTSSISLTNFCVA